MSSRALAPEVKAARAVSRALDGLDAGQRAEALHAALGEDDPIGRLARQETALRAIRLVVLGNFDGENNARKLARLGLGLD